MVDGPTVDCKARSLTSREGAADVDGRADADGEPEGVPVGQMDTLRAVTKRPTREKARTRQQERMATYHWHIPGMPRRRARGLERGGGGRQDARPQARPVGLRQAGRLARRVRRRRARPARRRQARDGRGPVRRLPGRRAGPVAPRPGPPGHGPELPRVPVEEQERVVPRGHAAVGLVRGVPAGEDSAVDLHLVAGGVVRPPVVGGRAVPERRRRPRRRPGPAARRLERPRLPPVLLRVLVAVEERVVPDGHAAVGLVRGVPAGEDVAAHLDLVAGAVGRVLVVGRRTVAERGRRRGGRVARRRTRGPLERGGIGSSAVRGRVGGKVIEIYIDPRFFFHLRPSVRN